MLVSLAEYLLKYVSEYRESISNDTMVNNFIADCPIVDSTEDKDNILKELELFNKQLDVAIPYCSHDIIFNGRNYNTTDLTSK